MHTIQLNVHDSIYEKLMGLLEILPQDKVQITEESDYPTISFEEAQAKVRRAANNISEQSGVELSLAIDEVLRS